MSLELLQELDAAHVIGTYARLPLELVRGEGARVWDDEGREYLDLLCGISVTSLGHCHPAVVEAVRDQAGTLIHASNLFFTEPGLQLAKRLSACSLGGKVFFCNSGAEANEAALKLARREKAGGEIVSVVGGFHGRTFGALSATAQESKQAPFAPLVPGFRAVARDGAGARGRGARRHRGGPDRADPGRGRGASDRARGAAGGAPRVRSPRGRADLRRGADRHGPHRHAVGLRADRRRPRRADDRQGTRRRPADRRARDRPAPGGDAAGGRSRLDVRRRAARRARGARGTGGHGRPGAARAGPRPRRAAARPDRRARRRRGGPWPRPDDRLRPGGRRRAGVRAARARPGAPDHERHRPGDGPAAAAADADRRRGRRRGRAHRPPARRE